MKTLATILFLILFSSTISNAQQFLFNAGVSNVYQPAYFDDVYSGNSFTPSAFNNESLGYLASAAYFIDTGWAVQLKANFDFVELEWDIDSRDIDGTSQNEFYISSARTIQKNFTISPGIMRQFKFHRLAVHGAFEIPVCIIGDIEQNNNYNQYDASSFPTSQFSEVRSSLIPCGYSIGLGASLGAAFKIVNHLSLGIDYNASLRYQNVGGNYTTYVTYPVITNNPTAEEYSINDYRIAKGWAPLYNRISFTIGFDF